MALLTCRNLTLGYDGREVLRDLHFTVFEGDYLCVIGENGSGKSTLMRTILGLQKPLSGEIEMGGGLRRSEIGYLPQQTPVQKDFPASVWEVVLSGAGGRCGARPFYNKEEKRAAAANLERLGAGNLARRCFRELSGGQRQRVLLARALLAARKMLLLDEPTGGLDPAATADLYRLIDSLHGEGVTIMMITHDISQALRYATRILLLGEERFFGSREEFLASGAGRRFAGGGEA